MFFASPLSLTLQHDQYVLVMIERFFKWLQLMSLPNYSVEGTTYAILVKVLKKFGVLIELFIHQHRKFCGEYEKLCVKALINHQTTSQDHPKVHRTKSEDNEVKTMQI
jgi:hypothetical protein